MSNFTTAAERLCDENAKLRDDAERMFNANVEKNGEITRLLDENTKLHELFYKAWEWMQRARYDGSIRANEMDEIGVKAIKLGFPNYELGMEVN